MDWFRAEIVGVILSIIHNNPLLNFTTIVDTKSGELRNEFFIAKYKGFKIKLYPHPSMQGDFTRGTIEGSLHYFWNGGIHNYNRFPFLSQIVAARELVQQLGIEFKNLRFVQLEIGVNLILGIVTDEVLNALRFHRRNTFTDTIRDRRGHYKQAIQKRIYLKAYDKGLQNELEYDVFRFEIKSTDLTVLRNKFGELTFETLYSHVYPRFKEILLARWDECIFVHPDDFETSSLFYEFHDQQNWLSILQNKNKDRANENWKTKRRKLDGIISNNPTSKKNLIRKMIAFEFDCQFPFNPQMVDLSILTKWGNRICPITGVDISMQRNDSFYLSQTGLKHLQETDPKKYDQLKRRFLSGRFWSTSPQKQIQEIAHKIRRRKQSGYESQKNRHPEQLKIGFEQEIEPQNN